MINELCDPASLPHMGPVATVATTAAQQIQPSAGVGDTGDSDSDLSSISTSKSVSSSTSNKSIDLATATERLQKLLDLEKELADKLQQVQHLRKKCQREVEAAKHNLEQEHVQQQSQRVYNKRGRSSPPAQANGAKALTEPRPNALEQPLMPTLASRGPSQKPQGTLGPTQDRRQLQLRVCERLSAEDAHGTFEEDPMLLGLPRYEHMIKKFMWMEKVRQWVKDPAREYSWQEFLQDVTRIYKNALTYNKSRTPVWKEAKRLLNLAKMLVSEYQKYDAQYAGAIPACVDDPQAVAQQAARDSMVSGVHQVTTNSAKGSVLGAAHLSLQRAAHEQQPLACPAFQADPQMETRQQQQDAVDPMDEELMPDVGEEGWVVFEADDAERSVHISHCLVLGHSEKDATVQVQNLETGLEFKIHERGVYTNQAGAAKYRQTILDDRLTMYLKEAKNRQNTFHSPQRPSTQPPSKRQRLTVQGNISLADIQLLTSLKSH
uniref:Bromo domain-containing protein n=1 Tax=Eutreptiella gymnastica TaxID=73025 RepID=A0A7S1I143_9EUGL|mmetsp:Transcript_119985/g.208896  ORF Transcript_119985/g.208896 Transcript_119985/m.208896 type:complete len:491 (+) Transcript_119985:95-1567(+)